MRDTVPTLIPGQADVGADIDAVGAIEFRHHLIAADRPGACARIGEHEERHRDCDHDRANQRLDG